VRAGLVTLILLVLVGGGIFADWWICLPEDTQSTYVGRASCAECHAQEMKLWTGSDHDLAMDLATPETVLGDFDNAQLTHLGITSRMYRQDGTYMIHTEGPDGKMHDYPIKYVLGVRPLQQYMVEIDRPAGTPDHEVTRVQVLRVSWDTEQQQWFYLSPPDVDEKLAPDDPLHWTQAGQNWNHMCADCHSTNVHKNFDIQTKTYHTTFSEIDVSCETCHGPASTHVQLARSRSLFWDRRLGYGLPQLKSDDSRVEIESCAPCHSRRHVVCPDYRPGESYYQNYVNELLESETYYPDGQILDEVYVYGSFLQSKMYQQGVRCTDCHDPHSGRLKHEGNKVCTSCHQHDPAKYDTPAHHRHEPESTGSLCVECHIPESPFMEVDPRRDHSFRVPRPDLSVKLRTPNACTGCHLEPERIDPDKRDQLKHYADWLAAARAGDQQIRDELARLDQWSLETVELWYGERTQKPQHDPELEFAEPLAQAWRHDPAAVPDLLQLAENRFASGMVRASALNQLMQFSSTSVWATSQAILKDPDPQVRLAALRNLENVPRR
jgi:predicted CXXCH cytochrome family protein